MGLVHETACLKVTPVQIDMEPQKVQQRGVLLSLQMRGLCVSANGRFHVILHCRGVKLDWGMVQVHVVFARVYGFR